MSSIGVDCVVDDCDADIVGLDDGWDAHDRDGVACSDCWDYHDEHHHWPDEGPRSDVCVQCLRESENADGSDGGAK